MRFPMLTAQQAQQQVQNVFLGYNATPEIGAGEFADMKNLSSDAFPLLCPRRRRGTLADTGTVTGIIARDSLCYVNGSAFVVNGYPVELGLTPGEKQLVSMGAYVLIFPDKKYINTLKFSDFGNLEAEFTGENVQCIPAAADGSSLTPAYIQPEEPSDPENMALWLDNAAQPGCLMQWSAGSGMWVPVEATYVKLAAPGIGQAFREGDGLLLEGLPEGIGSSAVVRGCDRDWLLVPGLLERQTTAPGVRLRRAVPAMDYMIECGNRLWGCRCGVNDAGEVVNEIYASKLGDFTNWNCFEGTASDSYAVSLGAEGPFTGAIAHMGYPLFFRENCLHKMYGSYPANFRLQTIPCRGVQRGSAGSLAIVGEILYYKAPHGVCAYDGALPVEVGQALGAEYYHSAAAGSHRGKYYLSMADAGGEYHLFVWDTARKLWHREDGTRATAFCSCREELYFLDETGKIRTVFGSGQQEGPVPWMAQTGPIGVENPGTQYLTKLTLRCRLERDAQLRLWVRYDGDREWQKAAELRGMALGSAAVPLGLRRCDHVELRLEGMGDMRLYSLTKTMVQGSDAL